MRILSFFRALIALSFFCLLFCEQANSQENPQDTIYIDGVMTALKVAVPDFRSKDAASPSLSVSLREILSNDLNFSGVLETLESRQFIQETDQEDVQRGKIDFAEWRRLQADLLVKGTCSLQGERLAIEAIVFDCRSGKDIVGRRYSGPPSLERNMIHRFADEAIYYLTGRPGCAESQIAFVSDKTGHRELYVMDYDGENIRQLTRNKSLVIAPTWSPDGRRLAITTYHRGDYPALYKINADGSGLSLIATAGSLNVASDWHPKMDQLTLTLNVYANPDVYTVDLRSGARTRLTRAKGVDISPTWSPDGREICFCSDRRRTPQLYLMDANGQNIRCATVGKGRYNCSPDWCPVVDNKAMGAWIVFSSRHKDRPNFEIALIRPGGEDFRYLTEGRGNSEDPSWSPDGRHVVFTSNPTGRRRLYVATLSTGQVRPIPCGEGEITTPSWGPRLAP